MSAYPFMSNPIHVRHQRERLQAQHMHLVQERDQPSRLVCHEVVYQGAEAAAAAPVATIMPSSPSTARKHTLIGANKRGAVINLAENTGLLESINRLLNSSMQ